MRNDMLKKAEAFVDKVVTPARRRQATDSKTITAKTDLARKNLELARAGLAGSGIDLSGLDKLAAERSKERRALADLTRHNAVAASGAAAARLRDMAPGIVPFEPMDIVIDQVTFIRSFADQGTVLEWNIGPSENWARYRLESSSETWDGTGRLSFFILWKNDHSSATVMIPKPNLIINARLSCDADWSGVASWFGMSSQASAKVGLRTTVWGMDSSVSAIVHQEDDIAHVGVDGGFFGGDDGTSIEFNQVLPATGVVVPSQTYVLIEVEVLTQWNANSNASVTLDAESGSHRVDLPQIVLSTDDVEPPPPQIALTAGVDHATSPPTVLLVWTGATGPMVDVYQNGTKLGNTINDGAWMRQYPAGTYTFRICEAQSQVCSADVKVVVT